MVRFFLVFLLIFQTPVGFAKTKKKSEFAPYQHDVAIAARNALKNLETVNGVLTWLAEFVPKEDLEKTRSLLSRAGLHESDYLPNFQVKGNKVYYGRDSITIEPGYVIVNKKKYKIDGRSFYEYMEAICKDHKCINGQHSLLHKVVFGEAQALGVLAWFGIGVITGVIGSWLWRRWRARRLARRTENYIYDGREWVNYELYNNRNSGEQYVCRDGQIYLVGNGTNRTCLFSNCSGSNQVNPTYTPTGRSCDEQAEVMTARVRNNNSQSPDAQNWLQSGASRAVNSLPVFTPTPLKLKGYKKWQPRRPF